MIRRPEKPILLFDKNKLSREKDFSVAILTEEPRKKLTIPYIVVPKDGKRIYRNFRTLGPEFMENFLKDLYSPQSFLNESIYLSKWAIKYHAERLKFNASIYYTDLLLYIMSFLKYKYYAYSIACAILTALFFTESGIPENLSVELHIKYVKEVLNDIFDILFLPVAFFYLAKLLTDEHVLELVISDPVYIARDFLSFICWKEVYPFLQFLYERIVKFGLDPEKIWITL